MQLEFPMLTIATQMEISVRDMNCQDIYTSKFGMQEEMATSLCTQSTNFTFADPFQTSLALTNTYLYLDVHNEWYFNEFVKVSGVPAYLVTKYFYDGEDG